MTHLDHANITALRYGAQDGECDQVDDFDEVSALSAPAGKPPLLIVAG